MKLIVILFVMLGSCIHSNKLDSISQAKHFITSNIKAPNCKVSNCDTQVKYDNDDWIFQELKQNKDTVIYYFTLTKEKCICEALNPRINYVGALPLGVGFVRNEIEFIESGIALFDKGIFENKKTY